MIPPAPRCTISLRGSALDKTKLGLRPGDGSGSSLARGRIGDPHRPSLIEFGSNTVGVDLIRTLRPVGQNRQPILMYFGKSAVEVQALWAIGRLDP